MDTGVSGYEGLSEVGGEWGVTDAERLAVVLRGH